MRSLPEIPEFLSHLEKDPRGYPIPFFVGYVDGKPDFRILDGEKAHRCNTLCLCAICGKKIRDNEFWFISGPIGFQNRISSDPGMHERCARFSMQMCPHIYLEKADRRDVDNPEQYPNNNAMILEKPKCFMLVKANKFRLIPNNGSNLIKYRPTYAETWVYKNGVIEKEKQEAV